MFKRKYFKIAILSLFLISNFAMFFPRQITEASDGTDFFSKEKISETSEVKKSPESEKVSNEVSSQKNSIKADQTFSEDKTRKISEIVEPVRSPKELTAEEVSNGPEKENSFTETGADKNGIGPTSNDEDSSPDYPMVELLLWLL